MTTIEGADAVLLAGLAAGLSYGQAAEAAGVSRSTAERRMREPAFRAAVLEERARRAEEAASALEGLALRAVERLAALVEATSELVALKAVLAVLDRATERRQARELGDRLAAIEARLDEAASSRTSPLRAAS